MAKPVEKPVELSRAAALWMEAMRKRDAAAAARLIKENPHETARGLLADPEVWRHWKDVARRALVPTENCASQLFIAWPLITKVEEDLLFFGNADPVVFALYKRVAELNANLTAVFEDMCKETNRRMDFLGTDIALAVFPDDKLQPELH